MLVIQCVFICVTILANWGHNLNANLYFYIWPKVKINIYIQWHAMQSHTIPSTWWIGIVVKALLPRVTLQFCRIFVCIKAYTTCAQHDSCVHNFDIEKSHERVHKVLVQIFGTSLSEMSLFFSSEVHWTTIFGKLLFWIFVCICVSISHYQIAFGHMIYT